MYAAAKRKILQDYSAQESADLSRYVPKELAKFDDPQTAIPRIAKDAQSIRPIERAVHQVPTSQPLHRGDDRDMPGLQPQSVHLVLTSPPYWTLKEYRDSEGQLGHVQGGPTTTLANGPRVNLAYTSGALASILWLQ